MTWSAERECFCCFEAGSARRLDVDDLRLSGFQVVLKRRALPVSEHYLKVEL
jgi:hypothetical protein